MKTCLECGADISNRHGSAKFCSTVCGNRSRNRKYYHRYPEMMKNRRDEYNSDVAKRMHIRVKCRAKTKGIPYELEVDDIVVPEKCPVLGLTLTMQQGRQGYHPNSPSLDRTVPSKGYVRGNVRVISSRANLLKNDATVEELERVLKDLKEVTNATTT